MPEHVLEGTWEEIAEHGGELSGKRVRLTILDQPSAENGDAAAREAKQKTEDLRTLIGAIDSRELSSKSPRKRGAYGKAVVEKLRKQGLRLR